MSTKTETLAINPSLQKYISTRDKRVAQVDALSREFPMTELFNELLSKKRIQVGGRSSCGGKVDPTWVAFTSWNEVVSKANKLGYHIQTNSIKQANKSPTLANGWWYENEYIIAESIAQATGSQS